jgi:hypothetical protein
MRHQRLLGVKDLSASIGDRVNPLRATPWRGQVNSQFACGGVHDR